jgi:hypothetical protein
LSACARSASTPAGQLPPVETLTSIEVAPGLHVRPRSEWGADLPPKGAMGPEDVKFLLVHHTASSNVVPDPREVIRQTYAFQTGPMRQVAIRVSVSWSA